MLTALRLSILLAIAAMTGCGGSSPDSRLADLNSSNLQRIANLYRAYQLKHESAGPADESALRAFVSSLNPKKLERIGVDPGSIDDMFISERDNQPFNIRYGVRGSVMGSNEPVVFEAEGRGGMRLVGFLDMSNREVDAAEYDQLWANGSSS